MQILFSGISETGRNNSDFTGKIIEYIKSSKDSNLIASNLFKSIKEKQSSNSYIFGNLKNTNYDLMSTFILPEEHDQLNKLKKKN